MTKLDVNRSVRPYDGPNAGVKVDARDGQVDPIMERKRVARKAAAREPWKLIRPWMPL